MSFATLATMALGGAALGALANPEDREKGALIGLGLGAMGPLAGMAGIGGGGVLGTSLGAGIGTGAGAGAGAATVTKASAPIVEQGMTTAALNANAGNLAAQQALTTGVGEVAAAEGTKATLGSKLGGFMKDAAPGMGVAALQSAMAPKPGVRGSTPQDLSLPVSQRQRVNPYERSLVNMQTRMQQKRQPRRFV